MKKLYKLLIICFLTIAGGSNVLNAKSYNNGDTKNNLATTNTNSTVTYTITVNASPSSYGTVSGGGEYEEGSIVTLTAEPKSGREFIEWQKDGVQVSTDTEYTFTVTESCTLTAKFKYKEYSITYYANDGSEQTYVDHKSHGSNYNIINHTTCGFTPPEGMVFIAWARNSVDGYQMAPGQSISNNSDCSFYAIWDTPVVSVIIGNDTTQYGSLVDAFNYANGKTATITMLKDWDNSVLSDHPKFTSNNTIVTLDLNGKRIYNDSYPSESNALEFSGDCIIKNGEIEFTGGGQYIKFYSTSSQKKLTIQGDVKITNKNSYGRCISLGNNNTVIIENGAEISSPNNDDTNEAAIFFYGNGTLIINGGTISSKKNCIFSNNNAPNSIVVVNAGNFNNVKAGDVYFNVEHNTTVIGNAWYKLTNNIPSTTATIEYTSNTTKYNETTYGLADNIVSVTATPTNNDIKISKLLANDIEATLTNDIYSFTMPKTIVTLSAETIDLIGNNKCGDNLYWHVDDENILTIFGTGAMYDYGSDNNKAPWCSLNPAPTSLVLEEGITHIGDYAFYNCSSFKGSLTIPNSVTSIGYYAFSDCSNFVCVYALASTAPELGDKTFNGINNTILIYDENNAISYESNGWFGYFSKKLKKDNENFLYIESTEDFMDYARISKETSNKFSVRLYADINLIGFEWTPFTMERDMVFDGNGHNIHIEQDWSGTESGSNFGLFHTYNYNVIKNLTMTGYVKANTSGNVGAITGSAYRTTISNVISYVEVTNIGSGRAGGLAGQFGGQHSGELYSLIENCAVYADVTGNVAGGIIGYGWSGNQYYDIKNVAYVGDVTGSERQAAVIAYHGNNSSATKCKFENIYYCEKDALGFVGGGGNNYDLGTDVAAMTAAQFASGEVAYLLQGEQATQVWGQNIDNGETVQAYPVFGGAKIYKTSCGDNYYYSNTNVEHSFNDNGFCNTCGNCEPAELVDNYYNISNAGNLVWFSKHVNDDNFSANAKLTNDIEMNAVQWTPIGTATAYNGTFDGQGHTINNLWHNTGVADGGREGLFTLIGSNGVVTNVTLNNATIWGSSPYGLNGTGGIAVRNEGCITNTMVTNSSIQQGAYEYLGGIAGWNKGSITNCAVINSTLTRRWGGANSGTMGGITQTNSGSVTNCYTYGCMFNNGNNLNSAIVAKENAAVNSYYYTTDNVADAAETARTKEQFASGEVAYLLQGEQTTQIWGQNIDNGETVQTYPVISDAKVYKHTFNGVTLYSNHKTLKAGGKCGDNLYWNVIDYVLTIYGTGAMWDYNYSSNKSPWLNLNPTPKSLVLKEGITHIGDSAFSGCSGFTGSLTIPNSVTSIGEGAFSGCSSFTGDLTIGNSVTSIGDWAFADCRGFNGSLTIPNSVTAIGSSAFRDCSGFTGSLTIPNSVTAIGNSAFQNCSGFTGDLTIPNSVTAIEGFAFCGCSGFNGSLTIPNSITTIGNAAFANCSGFNGSLTIPNSVTAIGDYAFQECSGFTDVYSFAVTAPTLGTDAFANINENATLYYPVSSYQSYDKNGWFDYFSNRKAFNGKCGDNLYWYVDVNNTLTIFGTGAMYDYDNSDNKAPWRSLNPAPTSLVLEEGITHIGNYAFYDCSGFTGSLTIPNSVTTIGNSAFENCYGFTGSLTIPNSVTSIGNYAFYYCYGFTGSLTIPNSVTSIGNYAFYYCYGFTGSLTIPNSVTSIGESAFYNCKGFTGSLTIPNSVTTIGNSAFYNCSVFTGSLTIGNSVTSIGNNAFINCYGFTGSLTIPNSVTTIGEFAFKSCSGFTDIFFYRDTNPTIGINALAGISSTAKIYAPVIWESYNDIPSNKLVKMATFVGEQSAVSGQQSGWVFPEGMTGVGADDHVAINAPMVISGQQSAVSGQQSVANSLSVKSFGYCGNGTTVNGSITIEEGAQLYCEVARGEVTVKKEILGYQQSAVSGQQSESESESESKWYTIASPLKDTLLISDPQFLNSSVPQFLSSNSDLYRYDEPTYTWQNAKPGEVSTNFQTIDPGRGYLYANANDTVLEFTGMINTNDVTYSLTTDGERLNGFHLVGNPFTHNITFAHLNATEGAELVNGYYVLNGEGAWGATLGSNEDDVIKVGQGVLVKAKSEGRLAISRQPSAVSRLRSGKGQQTTDNGQQSLCISVFNAKYSDRAFVVFDKGVGLDKMNHENENIPLLYIPMEDTDYAIAMMDINVNEIPVNFETNVMGQYTISLRQENCEFDELYLLDKETNTTVNILAEDYTFIATSSENPERFILMKDNGQQTTDNSHFAYINNGDIVIYNIEGDADIKIFDALGRCVYQGESSDETTRIANGYSAGVYMIQKVDDKGVNVQKIIL